MPENSISLLETLCISINRIRENYEGNWVVIGNVQDIASGMPESSAYANDFLGKAWEPANQHNTGN